MEDDGLNGWREGMLKNDEEGKERTLKEGWRLDLCTFWCV